MALPCVVLVPRGVQSLHLAHPGGWSRFHSSPADATTGRRPAVAQEQRLV